MLHHHRVCLADQVRVLQDGVEIALTRRKSQAILAVLALSAPAPVSREKIIALLWSESEETVARNALRQTLHRMRQELGPSAGALLHAGADTLALGRAEIDVRTAVEQARRGEPPALLEAQPDAMTEIAARLEALDPAFASWIAVRRQRLQEDLVAALGDSLGRCAPEAPEGVALARLLQRIEPTHEAACRHLMRAHHRSGNVAEALGVYNALWTLLDEEYDSLPSEETQKLVVAIKQPEGPAPAAPTPAPTAEAPAQPAAARRPARTPAAAPNLPPVLWMERFDIGHLADAERVRAAGLRSDLIAALCRFREWRVVDAAEGPRAPHPGTEMAVFSLSGTVVERACGAEIVLNFRAHGSGEVIWSERIGVSGAHWRGIERRTIRRIAAALNLHLSTARLARYQDALEPGLTLHDAWALGQALLADWTEDSEDKAERLFRGVLAERPDFAPASMGLAQVLNTRHLIRPGVRRSAAAHRAARELTLRAVALDPLDARTQLALAWSHALSGAWESAIESFRIALDLNDNDTWVVASSALGLAYCGDQAEAGRLANGLVEIGLGLTPMHWAYHACVRFLAGDFESAVSSADRAAGATTYIGGWRAAALAHCGRAGEARASLHGFVDAVRPRWNGAGPPDDVAVADWLLHCFPIRREPQWERLRDGLAASGAPVPDCRPPVPE